MKKILILFVFLYLLPSCQQNLDPEIYLDINNKNLQRLTNGNEYYKTFGLKTKINGIPSKVLSTYDNFIIKSDFRFNNHFDWIFSPFRLVEIDFISKEVFPLITSNKLVFLNSYNKVNSQVSPIISKELIELNNYRFSNIYSLGENGKSALIVDGIGLPTIDVSKIKIYKSSMTQFDKLFKSKYYLQEYRGVKFIHNPLTGYYSIYPDLRFFGLKDRGITLPNNIKFIEDNLIEIRDTLTINGINEYFEDLIIKNKYLIIEEESSIILHGKSNIYFENCEVDARGTKEHQIFIKAKGENTFYAKHLKDSKFNWVNLSGFSALQNDSLFLPSAITFYLSNISIKNSKFSDNKLGDDLVNFFSCKISINNSHFINSLGDALDSDFSIGDLDNNYFYSCGNDALDCSGSILNVKNCVFTNILDKAISAGENSIVTLENCKIINSAIGLTSKDGSILECNSLILERNILDIAVFQKKEFYSSPEFKYNISISNLNYLLQKGSKIKCPESDQLNYELEVEPLLYGNIYGKSSK
tara:strand:+ start:2959 stop:4542 length:1584 start_codon:yes stop_codon:yes gene_type:complete